VVAGRCGRDELAWPIRAEGTFVPADTRPVLYIVACGAPPASELPAFVRDAQAQGWNVCVIATPDGSKFLDAGNLSGLTGHPVRTRYKRPDEQDVLPPPNALVVAPATFNTVNKWAQGISDTLALGLLNEAVGLRLPIVAVPWPNAALAAHPVFARSIATLREWGVALILDPGRLPQPDAQEAATFPWDELRAILPSLRGRKAEPQAS
jgi:phosphopantothenoylcysteine synthetase/decarboxylase